MTRTITALFDSRADAEAGGERLKQAGIDASNVHVHDKTTHSTTGAYSTGKDKGLWASIKHAFLPNEDRHTYEEGIRRGGYLLTADVDEDSTPEAVRVLEDANSIDLDSRSQQWRADGWDYAGIDVADEDLDIETQYGVRDSELGGGRFRSYSVPPRSL